MKTQFMGYGVLLLITLMVPVMLAAISSLCRRANESRPSKLYCAILAGPMGVLAGVLLITAGVELVDPRLAFLMGMAGYCAREIVRQSWKTFMPCRLGLVSCLVVVAMLGMGCAGMGHKNDMSDIEFDKTNGKMIEGPKFGPFTLFGYYGGVNRKTDSRAVSGASGLFADESLQGFHAETVGVKGDTRKYGIQSYESKIRADAITAALDPLKNIVSDVVRAYLAGPAGDIWAGAATTEEKLTKSIEVAKDDPKAPDGTVEELEKALAKLKG